jgi:hypothetical protein
MDNFQLASCPSCFVDTDWGGYVLNGNCGMFFVYFYLDHVVSVTMEEI